MGSCSMKSTENQSSILKLSKSSKLLPTSDDRRDFDSSLLSPRHKKLRSKSLKSYTLQNSKSIQEFSSKKPSNHLKSSKDQIQIKSFFKSHFLFNSLTEEDLFSVIDSMFFYSFLSGEIIFHQGEPGVTFYIVRSGVLEVLVNNNRINTIKEGQGFGELALMHDSVRSATVRTVTNVDLWGLSKEVFQKTLESVSVRNFQENLNFVVALPVFCGIDIKRVENFVMGLNTLNFHNGQVIIRQKDWDDLFYLVKSGIVSCSRGGYEIKKFYPGDYFGEQAVLYHSPRTATCIAVGDVQCLSINLYQLQSTLGTNIQNVMFRNTLSIILIQDPYLSKLLDSQIDSLINSIEILKCPSGSILLKKNESIDKIIMVLNGHLTSGSFTFKTLEVFGIKEAIFQSSTLLSKDLLSEEDSELGVISHQNFFKAIGGDFESVTRNNEAFKSLSQVPILKSLSKENLLALKDLMKIVKYQAGKTLFEEGSPGDSLFIVKSGSVQVTISNELKRIVSKFDYFGERSVLFNSKRSATVIALEDVELWELDQKDFKKVVDQRLSNQLIKRIVLQDENLILEDLLIIKLIGKGTNSNAFLSVSKTTKIFYAVKTVSRKRISTLNLEESLKREKQILMQLDHPFIMKSVKTLKDTKRVYFICEYVKGIDFFEAIRKMSVVSEDDSRFYIACLIEILKYLHEKNIVHRDLKPENIMVEEDGYLKLTNFSNAKIVNSRTYSLVGSPHYIAPEVILRKGYGISADYWSLGIILYELLYEQVPFGFEENDPLNVYASVLKDKVFYQKNDNFSKEVKDFIGVLLRKDPNLRLARGFQDLRGHCWFRTVDWEKILFKEERPPFLPLAFNFSVERVIQNFSYKQWDALIKKEENEDLALPLTSLSTRWDFDF